MVEGRLWEFTIYDEPRERAQTSCGHPLSNDRSGRAPWVRSSETAWAAAAKAAREKTEAERKTAEERAKQVHAEAEQVAAAEKATREKAQSGLKAAAGIIMTICIACMQFLLKFIHCFAESLGVEISTRNIYEYDSLVRY